MHRPGRPQEAETGPAEEEGKRIESNPTFIYSEKRKVYVKAVARRYNKSICAVTSPDADLSGQGLERGSFHGTSVADKFTYL